ncbi:hypothetical protein DIPPA_13996 [Diplonema papillatum]|nr:hypothetical protein DIPPA_13996 [Diplonema papillatum]
MRRSCVRGCLKGSAARRYAAAAAAGPGVSAAGESNEASADNALAGTAKQSQTVYVNPDRPTSIEQAGDGPIPLDFKPGEGTDIIDHQVELSERFYRPVSVVPLDALLEHEKKREYLRIYRDNPERETQLWEGGMPRFIRAPMHMLRPPMESRNIELPPGPVLHDTRTGVAIRILGQMIPSPEMAVREDDMRNTLGLFMFRIGVAGWMFALGFLYKFTTYMALRTKLRSQGIANPVSPQNRVKVLEIIWFARNDFKRYKELFDEFKNTHWIPYRRAKLREDGNVEEAAAAEVAEAVTKSMASEEKKSSSWFSWVPFLSKAEEPESHVKNVYIAELGKSFDIDTSRVLLGMSPDGPVYAPPDAELLYPEQLSKKIRKVRSKVVTQMDADSKAWSADNYNKRARDQANEFIVQFHMFLNRKGVITPLDADTVDSMYELHPVPRVQDITPFDAANSGAAEGTATRPQLVRVK